MNVAMLILRLGVGLTVAAHGAQKLFGVFEGHGISGTAGFLESLGFHPGRAHAWLLGLVETVGGLALALGLLTPLAAAAIAGVMLTAAVVVHLSQGFFNAQGGYEYVLMLAVTSIAVAFAGPGRYSLDHELGWHLAGTSWGLAATAVALGSTAVALAWRRLAIRSRFTRRAGRGEALTA